MLQRLFLTGRTVEREREREGEGERGREREGEREGERGERPDLLKLPAVTHSGDHLCEFILVTLQHPENTDVKHSTQSWLSPVDVLPVGGAAEIVPGRYPATF